MDCTFHILKVADNLEKALAFGIWEFVEAGLWDRVDDLLVLLHRTASRGPGGWPAMQAGLLGTAPQCIPFEQRLLVFRALVAEDKERYEVLTLLQCLLTAEVSSPSGHHA